MPLAFRMLRTKKHVSFLGSLTGLKTLVYLVQYTFIVSVLPLKPHTAVTFLMTFHVVWIFPETMHTCKIYRLLPGCLGIQMLSSSIDGIS